MGDEKTEVRISSDEMEAYITLHEDAETEYGLKSILESLEKAGVRAGIDEQKIQSVIDRQIYDREVVIAKGVPAKDGKEGYFDYNFDCNFDNKPKILPDGSVDYWSIHNIETVVEGQVIAVYHPATMGENGFTVKGKTLIGKKGRELPPLKGKGFERSEDNVTYTATLTGKIEKQGERIAVLPVYEIFGNAELVNGVIDFKGDLIIHGGVEAGMKISATGNITIDGVVEPSEITARKNVILRSGMLGGSIVAKGNLSAKFLENVNARIDGNIEADVFMNSDISCRGKVHLNGTRGRIIGGQTYGVEGIIASDIGNSAEIKTNVAVGMDLESAEKIRELEKRIQENEDYSVKIELGLAKFAEMERTQGVSMREDPRRVALLREKVKCSATLATDQSQLKVLKRESELSKGAFVRVFQNLYPGVCVCIDEMRTYNRQHQECVDVIRRGDKIVLCRIEEDAVG